jgi:N-6 DNA Methylase
LSVRVENAALATAEPVLTALRDGGWGDAASLLLDPAAQPDDLAPGFARQHVLRIAEQPILGVSIQEAGAEASPDTDQRIQRWAGNLAYNRHAPFSLVLTPRGVTLQLTHRYLPQPASETWGLGTDAVVDDPAETFRIASTSHSGDLTYKPLTEWLRPDNLTSGRLLREAESLATRSGYERRTTVDQVLLDHLFGFRTEVLRADDRGALDAAERAYFDAALVSLIARILFIRHLEDHGQAGWYRGRLLETVGNPEEAPSRLAEAFAELHHRFDSELYPAAKVQAYRVPALTGRDVRHLVEGLYCNPRYGVVYDFRALEGDSLGLLYQQFAGLRWPGDRPRSQLRLLGKDGLVPEALRERFGIYYTPNYAVDALLNLTLGRWLDDHKGPASSASLETGLPRVLDLAAGSGVFLARAYRLVRRRFGSDWDQHVERWVQNLHGADIDARAVALARLNLWMEYARDRTDAQLPSLARTIRVADSLLLPSGPLKGPTPPLPEEWIRLGFDVVIGNPPFLSHRELTTAFGKRRVGQWRGLFRAASKETNLAAYFVERALGMLRPGGYLGMVVPRNLIKTESGEALRRILRSSCEIVAVIDLLDATVFEDATAAAALLVVRRPRSGVPASKIGVGIVLGDVGERPAESLAAAASIGGRPAKSLRNRINLTAESEILEGRLFAKSGDAPWLLENERGRSALRKLMEGQRHLPDYVQASYAVDEGLRGAFVLTNVTRSGKVTRGWSAARGAEVEIESKCMREALRAAHVGVLGRMHAAGVSGIIYPYDRDTGEVAAWEELRRFPLLCAHLKALQVRLMGRLGHGANDGWWVPRAIRKGAAWHRKYTWSTPLLLLRRHGTVPHATLTSAECVPVGNLVAWVPREHSKLDLRVLVALFSSTIWWWLVQITGTVGVGKLYRLSPSLFAGVTVPQTLVGGQRLESDVISLVDKAMSTDSSAVERLTGLWNALDDLVFDAYELTSTERKHVRTASRVYGPKAAREGAIRIAARRSGNGPVTGLDLFSAGE